MLVPPELALGLTILSKFAVLLFAVVVIGFLVLRQPPTNGAKGVAPRLASLFGTYLIIAIMLIPASPISEAWLAGSTFLIFAGMAFALYSILSLGRSFSLMAEARELIVTGPYARVRHALYVGEVLAGLGLAFRPMFVGGTGLPARHLRSQPYRQ